ncbi:hypothetical protein EVA_18422 [gut metagenome]|uniref:Uncharacterized protein n=1 Tax=gut metagenome TaxID=749906 RepID=J9FV69_9ZZZZ
MGLTCPRERSKSVACTCMQSGFPLTCLAWMPAGNVSQSWACMMSKSSVLATTPAMME